MSIFGTMGPQGAAMGGGMGLLNDPRMAALLGASSGLLNMAGQSTQKSGFGGAMGAGLGGAMGGMMGAEQMGADREMQKMMMDFMRQQMGQGAQQQRPQPMPISPGPRQPRLPGSMPIAPMGHPMMQPQQPPQFPMPMARPTMPMASQEFPLGGLY